VLHHILLFVLNFIVGVLSCSDLLNITLMLLEINDYLGVEFMLSLEFYKILRLH